MDGVKEILDFIIYIKNKLNLEIDVLKNSIVIETSINRYIDKFITDIDKAKAVISNDEIKRTLVRCSELLKSELVQIKQKANKIRLFEQKIKYIEQNIKQGHIFTVARIIEKDPKYEKLLKELYPEVLGRFDEIRAALLKDLEEIFINYPSILSDSLEKKGIKIDAYSHYPKLSIAQGFIKIEVNEKKRRVIVRDYEKKLCELMPDIDVVVEAIVREFKRLFEREFKGEEILAQIWESYKKILNSQKLNEGESIPIRALIKKIREKNKRFRLDEFIVDLTRLADKGPYEISGYTIDFQHTRDTNKGILLQGNMSRGYIGFILFRRIT